MMKLKQNMFFKLKMQLVSINVFMLSIILAIVFSGIYYLIKFTIDIQTHSYMVSIAKNETLISPFSAADKVWSQSNTLFIRIDENNQMLSYSANASLPEEDVPMLLSKALAEGEEQGFIKQDAYNLKYLIYPKAKGHIVVFLDHSIESFILDSIVARSFYTGLICLSTVFLFSLYLANKAIRPIRLSWERQKEFVADASHELRTPIAVITSNLEVVMDNPDETVASQSHWLNNIQEELENTHKLVNDLLQLARFDANEEYYLAESYDLIPLIHNTVSSFRPLALKHGIQIDVDTAPIEQVYLSGNAGRMKQLLGILIDNAIQYNVENGSVYIKARLQGNHVLLSVKDTGEGIEAKNLVKIFDRFYRADKSRARNNGGSGLGLAIAKCIVLEHKGKITVHSEVNHGTEFNLQFPYESLH